MKKLMIFALGIVMTCGSALAQPAKVVDPHHPAGDGSVPDTAQADPEAGGQASMMGMPMMNMMQMMNMMRVMSGPMARMGVIDHVEGRIAFLHAELQITDDQAEVWDTFSDALRQNAGRLNEVRALMMPREDATPPQPPTLSRRLDLQEQWLAAQLEGTRAIRVAFDDLYAAFSDEQKMVAENLFVSSMGMGMGLGMGITDTMPMMRGAP